MARTTPVEIIQFHWNASFEHPPFWQLLMHLWSTLAGQGEFALRFLPALAGTVMIPLVWQLGRRLEIRDWRLETGDWVIGGLGNWVELRRKRRSQMKYSAIKINRNEA